MAQLFDVLDGARRTDACVLRRGHVEVTVVKGKLNIVNVLRMNDEYLYGLGEVPASWPGAALRAQAVAARSYALSVSQANGQWDLCDTTQCQVYAGQRSVSSAGTGS